VGVEEISEGSMGVEVGGKKVGGGECCAFAEELGTGLEVGDATVEVEGLVLESGEGGGKEGSSEGMAANGLAKRAGTRGEFRGRAKNLEGLVEEGGMGGGEGGGGASDGGEEFGLGEAKLDAMGSTEAFKLGDVEG
jgi:hypothetical protein